MFSDKIFFVCYATISCSSCLNCPSGIIDKVNKPVQIRSKPCRKLDFAGFFVCAPYQNFIDNHKILVQDACRRYGVLLERNCQSYTTHNMGRRNYLFTGSLDALQGWPLFIRCLLPVVSTILIPASGAQGCTGKDAGLYNILSI